MLNQIQNNIILKYDNQVPRYTSYPTAPNFTSLINSEIYKNWLALLPSEENISLYFHIPFCKQLCWYCGCYTKATRQYSIIQNYLKILKQEIKLIADIIKDKNHTISHIHFGGGSPTILSPGDFEDLIKKIKTHFSFYSSDLEFAIEIDPRNVDEEKIAAYAKAGVNRVSIGVQDFNYEVGLAINRVQPFELVEKVVNWCRHYGIQNINLDLIYGLPKQNQEMINHNIDLVLKLKPSRIALFAYAHVRWAKKHMRLINEDDLPNNYQRIEMYKIAANKLKQAEYVAIGLDHFSKPEDKMTKFFQNKKLKRNFQGYSTDTGDTIIGFGASAISYTPFGYAQNTLDFGQYEKLVLNGILPIYKGIKINREDQAYKKIIDEIMCYLEVDLAKFADEISMDRLKDHLNSLAALKNDNLVEIQDFWLKINKEIPQISRIVSSHFDQYHQPLEKRHSKTL